MAIIFKGLSKCPICNQLLNDNYVMFPPMISNTLDELFIFSDNALHTDCFNTHPSKEKALFFRTLDDTFAQTYKSHSNPKDLLVIGLLTTDSNEHLYKFNYTIISKNDINIWQERSTFLSVASKFMEDGKWISYRPENNTLYYLITEINKHI